MVRESKIRANAKYDREHCKGVYLKMNIKTDSDILERLSSVPNVQGYIKELIRQDIGFAPVSVFVPGKQELPSNTDKAKCLLDVAIKTGIIEELKQEMKKSFSAHDSENIADDIIRTCF